MSRIPGAVFVLRGRNGHIAALLAAAIILVPSVSEAAHHKVQSSQANADTTSVNCTPTAEQSSIGIRALQTELMVAGLKCSAEQWNAFTAKFKSTIKADADQMQRLFNKVYGKGGATKMNAFVTQLANDASERSNRSADEDYCKQENVLFEKILSLTSKDLERFSVHRTVTVPTPVALCAPVPDDAPPTQSALVTTPVAATASVTPAASATSVH
jgi:hypothetical protein